MSKFQKVYMPYGMRELQGGRWELFNRHYHALGEPLMFTKKPSAALLSFLNGQAKQGTQTDPDSGLTTVWFYEDICVPSDSDSHWQAYSAKLQKLASLKVE